ncbi:type 1 fimbrial protein [Salmonella enterica subsp. enterica serovar Albuquerque]|uniref:fimbrial protein n=1 Tax=Salmonella enterica TaxID=28901 RepID=UPI0009AEC194|nr:fimbrial protein [Salmonella enterica]EGZ3936269.1 type 1 fimbrial protein [Salmonella enterica subsp. enterica serovar Albuquerque]EKA9974865.1 type 1 fimbrial protein [Salmonella enterica subsp. enterica]EHK4162171.1 type 1 fimbrial protein [Salmonella enterica]EIF6085420.1 type 1 fimbrial protein [Salmonella enterica]EIF8786744.1 type 1 fimbrial protein [Salmonella enterica]
MTITYGKKTAVFILACGSLFAASSQATTIDITGLVIASPCVVNGGNDSLSVDLGTNIQANDLKNSGDATAWVTKKLTLTNCPASTTSFSVTFSGTTDTDDTDYYKNTGTATNLKLELTNNPASTSAYKNGAIENVTIGSTHAYDLELYARAVSKGAVMPGTIEGQVQATFTYQ